MKVSQRVLLIVLFIVIAGAGAYLYFSRQNQQFPKACLALPESSVFAYQGQNPEKEFEDLKTKDIYKFLEKNPSVSAFEDDFRFFDSVLKTNNGIVKSLSQNPVIVSLHVTSADNFQLLILLQSQNEFNTYDIEKLVKTFDPEERVLDHNFDNVTVTEILNSKKQPLFAVAFMDGIIALSRNTGLVEEAISAYHSSKSKSRDMIKEMTASFGQQKLFVNYARLPQFLNVYASESIRDKISSLADFASFADYTLKAEPGLFRLNGTLDAGPGKTSFLSGLQNQASKKADIAGILPSGTSMFLDWCADSFNASFSNHKNYINEKGKTNAWDIEMRETDISTGINPVKDILPAIGKEWGYAMLESAEGAKPEELLVFKASDSAKAYDNLKKLATDKNRNFTAIEYNGYQLNQIRVSKSFELLFGDLFAGFQSPYFTKVGDFLIFASNLSAIQKCIDAYKDDKTLKKSSSYKSFSKSLISETSFFMYCNPTRVADFGASYFKTEYLTKYKANLSTYRGFNGFAFQLAANGKNFYSQITLSKPSDKEGNVESVWTATLDASLRGKPSIVMNYESGTHEVMVQDSLNNLYLIGSSGSIIWEKHLEEPIQGDIYAMDLFQNEQSEYLFATTNKLYLLDHYGKDAGSYPLNLAEPTHTGLSLFDVDNNKEYTYFVCCNRGKIYGYNGNGKPLAGWVPKNIDAGMTKPIKDFTYNGKHYLFGNSEKGTVYLWDINGKQVMNPVPLHAGFKNSFMVSLDSKALFSADSTGNGFEVSFTGNVKKKTYPNFRKSPFFNYIEKDDNAKPELVLSSEKMISGFGPDSTELWKLITSDNIKYPPHIIDFNSKKYIGYVSVASAKVYLFTAFGNSFPNFPVTGNTDFIVGDLSGNGDADLIIGGPDKKLYHYRLSE